MPNNKNPLIGETTKDTIENVSEALNALLVLMSVSHSAICRLIEPLAHALEHAANQDE